MREFKPAGETVTSLFGQKRPMQDPILLDLLNYWEHLRGGRIAPLRSEIDPREIRTALEHTFILEKTPKGQVRIRLAGQKLTDRMGMELRGMPAYSLIAPEDRDGFNATLAGIFTDPKIVQLDLTGATNGGAAQMLLLPMRNDAGEINRMLGCISMQGRFFAPDRFNIAGTKITRIISEHRVAPPRAQSGFAETAPEFSRRPANPNRTERPVLQSFTGGNRMDSSRMRKTRPYLRLVVSD